MDPPRAAPRLVLPNYHPHFHFRQHCSYKNHNTRCGNVQILLQHFPRQLSPLWFSPGRTNAAHFRHDCCAEWRIHFPARFRLWRHVYFVPDVEPVVSSSYQLYQHHYRHWQARITTKTHFLGSLTKLLTSPVETAATFYMLQACMQGNFFLQNLENAVRLL